MSYYFWLGAEADEMLWQQPTSLEAYLLDLLFERDLADHYGHDD